MRVLVAGGAGGVGAGVVEAWLGEGATVVTLSRSPERIEALRAATAPLPGTLRVIEGAASDPSTLERLATDHGPFNQVVASIGGGGWRLQPLRNIDASMFARIVEDGIVAHWSFARATRSFVETGGSYVFVNGGAARQIVPGTGPLSLVARAQLVLAEIFDAEQPSDHPIRTTSLILTSPVATPSRQANAHPDWLTPVDAGLACIAIHRDPRLAGVVPVGTRAEARAPGLLPPLDLGAIPRTHG